MLYVDQHGSFFNAVDENPIGVDDNCISIQGYLLKLTILSNDRDLGHMGFFFFLHNHRNHNFLNCDWFEKVCYRTVQ